MCEELLYDLCIAQLSEVIGHVGLHVWVRKELLYELCIAHLSEVIGHVGLSGGVGMGCGDVSVWGAAV
jgi:hypothetical protein